MTQNINIQIIIMQTQIKYKNLKFIYYTKHKHRNKKLKKNVRKKNSIKFMPNLPEFEEKTKKVFRFLQHVPESKPEYKRDS
jgi:predicted ABC-type exoprotein transport system permease subunit